MTFQTVNIAERELVIVSREDFEALMEKAGLLPPMPPVDKNGTMDARAFVDSSIARSLISRRIECGWTQTELARRSGVRIETISRLESGKRAARRETLLKLDRALTAKEQTKSQRHVRISGR